MTEVSLAPEVVESLEPDLSHLVTEDDEPVDNIFSERQQRLLVDPLYASWDGPGDDRPFVAMANVGLFYSTEQQAVVPDTLLSLDVSLPEEPWEKKHRSYFIWVYGKPPEVVIEIVSNRKGGELSTKKGLYARVGIAYYVVYDPAQQLGERTLSLFERRGTGYVPLDSAWLAEVALGLRLWEGEYEGQRAVWLRWCDEAGTVLPTGEEAARAARQQAEAAQQQAEAAQLRAERLAAQLRALGIEPEA